MSKVALDKLATAVEQLQAQVAALSERLLKLEAAVSPAAEPIPAVPEPIAVAPVTPSVEPAHAVEHEGAISTEILLAISAAVAAYLGERAHVRAVRLVGSTRWSQEGRVSIQASHRLSRG